MDTFGEYAFSVRSYECGADGRATLPTVCNWFQEAASLNAAELKFAKEDFVAAGANITWVLTRLFVRMSRYPEWMDQVSVVTFPRGGRKVVAWRDFELRAASGELLGIATSEWMVIDLATRRLAPIPVSVFAAANDVRPPVFATEPFTSRLRFLEGQDVPSAMYRAMKSQIDLNGHVNNVHYVEWLLDPAEGLNPQEAEIVYRSETFAGEAVCVEAARLPSGEIVSRVHASDGRDHAVAKFRF